MPPDGSDECVYLNAKLSALESLKKGIVREIKQLEEEVSSL
jgi:hypothetical protein